MPKPAPTARSARLTAVVRAVSAGLLGVTLAGSAFAAMPELDRLWTIGASAFADGLYTDAYRILGRLIEIAPDDPRRSDASLLRGQAAFALGRHEDALAAFQDAERAVGVVAPPGEVVFWQAESLFRLKRFEEARTHYARFLGLAGSSPYADDALYGLGVAELEAGGGDAAIDAFRQLVDRHPDSPLAEKAAYGAALELVRAKRWDEALPLLETFSSRYAKSPNLSEAQYLLGVTLIRTNRAADGISLLERFLARAPTHGLAPHARALLGEAYVKTGRPGDALRQYEALVKRPASTALVPDALYRAGELYWQLGRPAEAEAAWTRLRRDHPADELATSAGFALAELHAKRRQFARAAEVARDVAEAGGPERLRGLLLAGDNALRARRLPDAREAFQTVLAEAAPDSAERVQALEGYLDLADAELKAGRATEAEGLYAAVLARASGDTPPRNRALDRLLALGEAGLRARKAADAEWAYALAMREASEGSSHRLHALAGLGALAELRGDAEVARRSYTEIIAGAKDGELVRWARERLRGLEPEPAPGEASPGPRPVRAPAGANPS